MTLPRRFANLILPGLLAATAVVFQAASPAAASHPAGVITGTSTPADDGTLCGLPQSGVEFSGNTFDLVDALDPTITIELELQGPYRDAPQGAAPGACGDPFLPVVPGAVQIQELTVQSGTSSTTCTNTAGSIGTYLRVNTTVVIDFVCDGTWLLTGNQSPEALPGTGNFSLTYVHS